MGYTGQKQLFYVGHSEGTTQAFAGFTDPSVASKVKLFVALAPVAYAGDISSAFIQTIATLHIDTILEIIGWNKFLVQHCWMDNLLDLTCDFDSGAVCQVAMCAVAGCGKLMIFYFFLFLLMNLIF